MRKVERRGCSAEPGPDRIAPDRHRSIAEGCTSSEASVEANAVVHPAPNGFAAAIVSDGEMPAEIDGTAWCSCAGVSAGADCAPE